MHLGPAAFMAVVKHGLQQSLITEPVTRLLELLLYSRFNTCLEVLRRDSSELTRKLHGSLFVCAVVNRETSVSKVMQ
jgi:hypothetical protein